MKDNIEVKFWTTVEGLSAIEECCPQPANRFIPGWFKDAPSLDGNSLPTVKKCPAFSDVFSQGYIIPMWSDVRLYADGDNWRWETPSKDFLWEAHSNDLFLEYTPSWVKDEISIVFKPNSPWRVKTPTGYSMRIMPLFYHFNRNYTALPGDIRTDIYHILNPAIMFHTKEKEVIIERGTPFVWVVPYKREDYTYSITEQTEELRKIESFSNRHINTKFMGGYISARKIVE